MKNWPLVPLCDIFDIARGGSPRPIQKYLTDDPDGINWIMIGDASASSKYIEKVKKRIRKDGANKSRVVYPGDFLLTNSMSFGHPYILKTSGCIHDGWLVLSNSDNRVDQDYFYYLLGSDIVYREFERRAAGAVVKNLNIDLVKSVEIPLPPLAEQKRIAAILDAADALRAKRRESLAQLDTLLQSTFLDMFGDPVTNPMGWEVSLLGKKAKRITKGQSPKWQGFDYQKNGVLFITSENVREGFLDVTKPKFVPQNFNEKLKSSQLQPGDLLINLVGASIRRSCLFNGFTGPANINQAVGVVTLDDPILSNYIVQLLQTKQGKSFLIGKIVEAARANISLKNLKELELPLPPLDLQLRFATIVESVEKQKDLLRAHLTEMDTLFASLQSRAFKGEL